jgi:hypothetical protein
MRDFHEKAAIIFVLRPAGMAESVHSARGGGSVPDPAAVNRVAPHTLVFAAIDQGSLEGTW